MCGIIGIIGRDAAAPHLIDALKRLAMVEETAGSRRGERAAIVAMKKHYQNALAQARKADLGGYQYAAFAFRGLWCAERTVTKSSGGRVLWDSGFDEYACE